MTSPLRVLTAVPLCDGHDSAISTVNLELIRHGVEVVYLGYHRSVRDVVRAAIQEDVAAVGISSYNGGHVEFFSAVAAGLRAAGATDVGVFGGGGGTITAKDAAAMKRRGVDRIFWPGESLDEMVEYVKTRFGGRRTRPRKGAAEDLLLARALTAAEDTFAPSPGTPGEGWGVGLLRTSNRSARASDHPRFSRENPHPNPLPHAASVAARADGRRRVRERGQETASPLVIGVTGPGGAGKTTLIDELVLRSLRAGQRVGILSHDPSIVGDGALLGDRATMIYSQDDRVFMRSMASRGRAGGLSPASGACLDLMKRAGRFDVLFVETVGIGQEALPFAADAVDVSVLVMSPDYGGRLQLQKIAMLDAADVVVVNKSDLARGPAAASEIGRQVRSGGRRQPRVVNTTAKRHADAGVDELFGLLTTGTPAEVAR